ncbi:hypothetical protein [Micromonospora echinofusca]|uniref:Uncharacterized protein n=1 Tax=Micromonospora echinofusca TaxID=47858 RepID=A0ABS3VUB8_MICEH|nr:hypothetical protein [Micromonospora echinofusca]MBO4208122.1 hypothetical protein [Micromonospora echinofusca]
MGIFGSLRDLNRQAKEINKGYDPAAQMRQGLAAMQQVRQQLAGQQATAHLATSGVPATATIVAVRETGAYVNGMPSVELQLMVTPAGRPPFPAGWTGLVPLTGLGQLRPGGSVAVRFDAFQPTSLTVLWGQPA